MREIIKLTDASTGQLTATQLLILRDSKERKAEAEDVQTDVPD